MIDTMTHMHGVCLGGVVELVALFWATLFGVIYVAVICLQLILSQLHCFIVLHMVQPRVWLIIACCNIS